MFADTAIRMLLLNIALLAQLNGYDWTFKSYSLARAVVLLLFFPTRFLLHLLPGPSFALNWGREKRGMNRESGTVCLSLAAPLPAQSPLEGLPTVTHSNYSWELHTARHRAGISLIRPQIHGHFNLTVWNWRTFWRTSPQNPIPPVVTVTCYVRENL